LKRALKLGLAQCAYFSRQYIFYPLNRFRILRIGNSNLEYEEVSTGLRGTANLEEQGGPPSA